MAALAALIIPRTDTPSAAEAGVPGYLDKILAGSPVEERASFLEGLAGLDGYCLRAYEQPFVKLPEARQVEVLTKLIETPFLVSMKQWTSRLYYATAAGHRELAKNGPPPASYACSG